MKRKPIIYAIAGIPTAGKTTFIAAAIKNTELPSDAFVHNSDTELVGMLKYQEDLKLLGPAAAFVKWESKAIQLAEDKLWQAVKDGKDIIYDRSCAMPDSLSILQRITQEYNYELIMYVLIIDSNVAIQRAMEREQIQKIHTPPQAIIEKHKQLAINFNEYCMLAKKLHVLDSSKEPPQLIESYENGVNVYDNCDLADLSARLLKGLRPRL